jgi:hypothetical protein
MHIKLHNSRNLKVISKGNSIITNEDSSSGIDSLEKMLDHIMLAEHKYGSLTE